MKSITRILAIGALALQLGCRPTPFPPPNPTAIRLSPTAVPASPTPVPPTATPRPTSTDTAAPSPTAATATPSPLGTGTDANLSEFVFAHFDRLAVDYDPAEWMSDKGQGQGFLVSLTISGCEITDQPVDEPPSEREPVQLGEIHYQRAIHSDSATGQFTAYYFLTDPLPPVYRHSANPPVFVVNAPQAGAPACQSASEGVLANLHEAPQ